MIEFEAKLNAYTSNFNSLNFSIPVIPMAIAE